MKRARTVYVIAANTAILLLLVEASAHVAIITYRRVMPPLSYRRLSEPARRSYAHMTPADVDELLRDTLALRYRYAHGPGLVPDAMTSRFVNVDAHGARSNGQGPRDLAAVSGAIWFFGGSTTFGSAVADGETIPAQLERMVGHPVINFGVPAHFSATENRLFNHYLQIGYRPAQAIFLDGINETCETTRFAADLDALVTRGQDGDATGFASPVTYVYARISRRIRLLMGFQRDDIDSLILTCEGAGQPTPLRTIHTRTLAERDALCRLYAVPCRTFVQPFPGVHGRHDDQDELDLTYMRDLFAHLEPGWRAAGALFITDAMDRSDRHGFVDPSHYNAAASRLIAEAIAGHLRSP